MKHALILCDCPADLQKVISIISGGENPITGAGYSIPQHQPSPITQIVWIACADRDFPTVIALPEVQLLHEYDVWITALKTREQPQDRQYLASALTCGGLMAAANLLFPGAVSRRAALGLGLLAFAAPALRAAANVGGKPITATTKTKLKGYLKNKGHWKSVDIDDEVEKPAHTDTRRMTIGVAKRFFAWRDTTFRNCLLS